MSTLDNINISVLNIMIIVNIVISQQPYFEHKAKTQARTSRHDFKAYKYALLGNFLPDCFIPLKV